LQDTKELERNLNLNMACILDSRNPIDNKLYVIIDSILKKYEVCTFIPRVHRF